MILKTIVTVLLLALALTTRAASFSSATLDDGWYRAGEFLTNSVSTGLAIVPGTNAIPGAKAVMQRARGESALAVFGRFTGNGTNAQSNSNLVFQFALSVDGTNYSTSPVTVTVAQNANTSQVPTNEVRFYAELTQDTLGNARYVKALSVNTAALNTNTLYHLRWGIFKPHPAN